MGQLSSENKFKPSLSTRTNMQMISCEFKILQRDSDGNLSRCSNQKIEDNDIEQIDYEKIKAILIYESEKCKNIVKKIGINNPEREKNMDRVDKELLLLDNIEVKTREDLLFFQAITIDILNNLAHYTAEFNLSEYRNIKSSEYYNKNDKLDKLYYYEKASLIESLYHNGKDLEQEGIFVGKKGHKKIDSDDEMVLFMIDLPKIGQISWHIKKNSLIERFPEHSLENIKWRDQDGEIVQNIEFLDGSIEQRIQNEDMSQKLDVTYYKILRNAPKEKVYDILKNWVKYGKLLGDLEYKTESEIDEYIENIDLDQIEDETVRGTVSEIIDSVQEKKNEEGDYILFQLEEISKNGEIDSELLKEVFREEFEEIIQKDKSGVEILEEVCEGKKLDEEVAEVIQQLFEPILKEYRKKRSDIDYE